MWWSKQKEKPEAPQERQEWTATKEAMIARIRALVEMEHDDHIFQVDIDEIKFLIRDAVGELIRKYPEAIDELTR